MASFCAYPLTIKSECAPRAIEISLKFVLRLVNKFGEPLGWYSGTTTSRFGRLDDEVFFEDLTKTPLMHQTSTGLSILVQEQMLLTGTISCTSSFLMGFTRSSRFTPRVHGNGSCHEHRRVDAEKNTNRQRQREVVKRRTTEEEHRKRHRECRAVRDHTYARSWP